MKKLITLFLSSIVWIGLWGQSTQKVPMAITGEVYIASSGKMNSVGPVHFLTSPAAKTARVANYGLFKMDTCIFYSNDDFDGLLMNKGKEPVGVNANDVSVRKVFKKSNVWYTLAFPFDVDLSNGVKNPIDGSTLVRGVHFDVQWFDAQTRANRGINDAANWKLLPAGESLKKGEAYHVAVKLTTLVNYISPADTVGAANGRFSVEFHAKDQSSIANLFSDTLKSLDLTYKTFNLDSRQHVYILNEGWNAFGSLTPANYYISAEDASTSVGYEKTIYYWNENPAEWRELNPKFGGGTLRPYGVIFVQTDEDTKLTRGLTEDGGFTFFSDATTPTTTFSGITLNSFLPVFRSSKTVENDVLALWLTDASNNDSNSRIFFYINDKYSKSFLKKEDDFRLTTKSSKSPIVWSLAKMEDGTNAALFINSLPSGHNEVPLGVNVPAAGEYVFSVQEFSNATVESVKLYDKTTKAVVDLLLGDYRFQATKDFNVEDRFVLYFNDRVITTTEPTMPETSGIYAFVENDLLTVKNLLSGDQVQVMDLTGRVVVSGISSGDTFSAALNQKGVYIVIAKGEKPIKVLNR